jgi:hypothetical protein
MSRTLNVAVPVALLFSALVLSACATKEAPPIEPPAPVEVVAEKPAATLAAPEPEPAPMPAPVTAPEPAPAPAVAAVQPTPKPVVHKAKKKKAKKAAPKDTPPAPVAAPAPAPAAPIVIPPPPPESSKPAAIVPQPVKKVAELGFLEQYWLWLLGLIVVAAGIVVWQKKSQVSKS